MTFKNAQASRVFAGSLNFSGYTTKAEFDNKSPSLDVTTLADSAFKYILGQETSTAKLDLILDTDTTAGGEWSVLSTWKTTQPQPLTWCPFGVTAGSYAQMASSLQNVLSTTATPTAAVKASLACVNDGLSDFGQVIEDGLTVISADTNGPALDNAAQTTNGGVWHVHGVAFAGFTSNSIVLEHSTDNSSWVTLDTATLMTGLTSERRVIAAGTTVRRYVRIRDDVTGTGTTSRFVALARR